MKRKLWIVLALAVLITAVWCTAAGAEAEVYEIYIAGHSVTSDQLSGLIDDTFSYRYDPTANVLHLQGTYEPAEGTYAALSLNVPGLMVSFDSPVSFTLPAKECYNAVIVTADTTFTGDYSLRIYGPGDGAGVRTTGILVGNATLTLQDMDITVMGGVTWGLRGSATSSPGLSLVRSKLDIFADEMAILQFRGGISLTGCDYERPFAAVTENGTVYTAFGSGSEAAARVKVTTAETYALGIDGIAVTSANKDNVTGTTTAYFVYDPASNRLTVRGAYEGTSDQPLIDNRISDLTIRVAEDADLYFDSTHSDQLGVITSTGSLDLEGAGAGSRLTLGSNSAILRSGVYMKNGAALGISGLELVISDVGYGLYGAGDPSVTLDNVSLSVTALDTAICRFTGGIALSGCDFVTPAYPVIRNGAVQIYTWDEGTDDYYWPCASIRIEPSAQVYGLVIDGTRVWSGNLDSLPGAFAFDPASNVLTAPYIYQQSTASSATLRTYRIQPVIDSTLPSLTLRLQGSTTLSAGLENYNSYVPVINTTGQLTINGVAGDAPTPLTLTRYSDAIEFDGVHAAGLTLENVNLQIASAGRALVGAGGALTFRHCEAELSAATAAVTGFNGGLTAAGCAITRPTSDEYSFENGAIMENGAMSHVLKVECLILASGTCGDDLTWTLYADGELVISGQGAMTNFQNVASVPWADHRSSIVHLSIGNDVTTIGAYAFSACDLQQKVTIPEGAVSM